MFASPSPESAVPPEWLRGGLNYLRRKQISSATLLIKLSYVYSGKVLIVYTPAKVLRARNVNNAL